MLRKNCTKFNAHTYWVFVSFAGRAGHLTACTVLWQSKGRESELDGQVLMVDSANNSDLGDVAGDNADRMYRLVSARVWCQLAAEFVTCPFLV